MDRKANRFSRDSDGNVRDTEGTYLKVSSPSGGRRQLREGSLRSVTEEEVLIGRQVDYDGHMAQEVPPFRRGWVLSDNAE